MKSVWVIILAVAVCGFMVGDVAAGWIDVQFDERNFNSPLVIDNPYWPLVPGTTFIYEAEEDEELIVNWVAVTNQKERVCGIKTRVVYDVEWAVDEDGERVLLEETFDWYAQDDFGNIWYFGEETYEYIYDDETGDLVEISTEGSWEACVDEAEAGIVMLAEPASGDFYMQEFYEDEAEDMGKVLQVNATIETDFLGEVGGVLKTKEWTSLEPGSIEHKFYVPGLGLALINELAGGTVRVELVDVIYP